MLAVPIGASLLDHTLSVRGMKSKIQERKTIIPGLGAATREGEETIRAGQYF